MDALVFVAFVVFVFAAGFVLSRRILAGQSRKKLTASTNPADVTVFNSQQVAQAVASLLGPGSVAKTLKLLNPNSPVWNDLRTSVKTLQPGPDSPFGVVAQVRAALLSQQIEIVRHLLSDRLYQRLSASPPMPRRDVPDRVVMVSLEQAGDDRNQRVVRIAGSVAVPGAKAEDWTLLRAPQAQIAVPALPEPAMPASPAAAPSACPFCGAPLDKGATRCRFCGMDATQAVASPMSTPQAAAEGWIVDDVSAANPMAA
ncbi:MAG TPA: hypothetical protein VFR68_00995 [Candidatus Dormibacteraeota bacterium]|nr:hypothetical protein [Candidatus Dormibacteraeota bacterium]